MKVMMIQKPAVKAQGHQPLHQDGTVFKAKPARKVVKVRPLKNLKDMVK